MHVRHLCSAALCIASFVLVVTPLSAGMAAPSGRSGSAEAKTPPKASAPAPGVSATVSTEKMRPGQDTSGATPQGKRLELAQLTGAGNGGGTAAQLLDRAEDYAWCKDWANRRAFLEAAAAANPGSKDSGRALVLLADSLPPEQADAKAYCSGLIEQYSDPEIKAFAALVPALSAACRSKDWETATRVLSDAALTWKGTATGAWAALRLGDLYRDYIGDTESAIACYQRAGRDYPKSATSQEAEVCIAESVSWAGGRSEEALELFTQALEHVTLDRLVMRAAVGRGDKLLEVGEIQEAFRLFSNLIENCPDRPIIGLAHILRAIAAHHLGYHNLAVEDAQAYLAWPGRQTPLTNFAHMVLGHDAFSKGLVSEAEREFGVVTTSPENTEWAARGYAGIAECRRAQGDYPGALAAFLEASGHPGRPTDPPLFVYQAALLAAENGDDATANRIAEQMASEWPGSYLTTRLLGRDLLPPPEI